MIFEQSLIVKKTDLDEINHVNNVVYLKWVQEVSEAHWRKIANLDLQKKFYWVAIRHEIDYKRQAFLGEEIILKTFLKSCGGVRSVRAVTILRKKDQAILVEALTVWCLISFETNKPIKITDEILDLFPIAKFI